MKNLIRTAYLALMISSALLIPSWASASVLIQSNPSLSLHGLGSYCAKLTYVAAVDGKSASMVVEITNTTSPAIGGYLDAFAFNNPRNLITGVTMTRTMAGHPSNHFSTLIGGSNYQNKVDADAFGDWDIGASIFSFFMGGANPANGLATGPGGAGQTGIFAFNFQGTNLQTLTENSFLGEFNHGFDGPSGGHPNQFFVARFLGMNGSIKNDTVPAQLGACAVPEPGTLAVWTLLGAVVAPFAWRARRNTLG